VASWRAPVRSRRCYFGSGRGQRRDAAHFAEPTQGMRGSNGLPIRASSSPPQAPTLDLDPRARKVLTPAQAAARGRDDPMCAGFELREKAGGGAVPAAALAVASRKTEFRVAPRGRARSRTLGKRSFGQRTQLSQEAASTPAGGSGARVARRLACLLGLVLGAARLRQLLTIRAASRPKRGLASAGAWRNGSWRGASCLADLLDRSSSLPSKHRSLKPRSDADAQPLGPRQIALTRS
jgi:hypothetical protein